MESVKSAFLFLAVLPKIHKLSSKWPYGYFLEKSRTISVLQFAITAKLYAISKPE